MKKAPKIGQRVQYRDDTFIKYGGEVRVCTGTVTAINPRRNAEWDENDEWVRYLPGHAPESEWSATVKVDRPLPKWWAYGEHDVFCPDVGSLQPEIPPSQPKKESARCQ